MKPVFVFVFDGYADWEIGHVTAELRRFGKRRIETVALEPGAVKSMGGLTVLPDRLLADIVPEEAELLILPGGHFWEGAYPRQTLHASLRAFEAAGIPVAGICAATTVLARAGLLDRRLHTSNSRRYLEEHVPEFQGHERYRECLAVRSDRVITASGLGAIEFALEIFDELGVMDSGTRSMWFDAVKHGIYPDHAAVPRA